MLQNQITDYQYTLSLASVPFSILLRTARLSVVVVVCPAAARAKYSWRKETAALTLNIGL